MKVVVDKGAKIPTRAHSDDAGLDLYSAETETIEVPSFGYTVIETGIHVQIPSGYVGLLTSKSGLMLRGITCRGTVDSGYTGSIKAILFNHSKKPYRVAPGDKVTQLVIMSCITPGIELVKSLEDTERGEFGFGSTGLR